VVDAQDERIRRIDKGGNVATLPCTGSSGSAFVDLFGVAADSFGNILVSDSSNHRICKTDPLGSTAIVVAGDDQGSANPFNFPMGLSVGPDGSVYVADNGNNVILKIDIAGNVTTLAGSGSPGFADGPAESAEFNQPCGVAVDPLGNVVVADAIGNRIRLVDQAGNVTTLAGNGQGGDADGVGGADGVAEFATPDGVAVDGACNVYVADKVNNRIRKITFGTGPP
jgi:DNA-binding beta-propeller fold protein YncE